MQRNRQNRKLGNRDRQTDRQRQRQRQTDRQTEGERGGRVTIKKKNNNNKQTNYAQTNATDQSFMDN